MTTTPHDKALKPCPFCGSPAERYYMRGYAMYPSGKFGQGAAVYCTACNADMMICREDMPELSDEETMAILEENWNRRAESFNCKARQQGSAGGNTPADCDWPVCGCDPAADRVISSLEESGIIASPLHIPIEAGNGGDGWLDISSAAKDSPIIAISWQEGYGSFESKWSKPEFYEWDEMHSYWANKQRGTCIWPKYQDRYRCKSLGRSPSPPSSSNEGGKQP